MGWNKSVRWRTAIAAGAAALWLFASCVEPGTALPATDGGDTSGSTSGNNSSSGGNTSSSSGTADPAASDPCVQVGQPASPTHREMFVALNDYRASKGLLKLSYSKVLEKAANGQALDMYERDFFDHTNPDGDGPAERALAAGFCRAWYIGENLAWNQQSVPAVQTAWENSPGHNANMINANFRYVGMGYYMSANGPYYVQLFGNVFPE